MGQALRDGLRAATQIRAYVDKLRAGQAVFDNDASEGRSLSLGAALSYGFAAAFTAQERATLALLHHFQGFVNVDTLRVMGDTSKDWHVPAVAGLTREQGIVLLDRAAEVGPLTAHGDGYFSIHPALPWFLRRLYEEHHTEADQNVAPPEGLSSPSPARGRGGQGVRATRAYVEAIRELGNYYHRQYEGGNRGVIALLRAEEANLLHARRLALRHGWHGAIIGAMQGLRNLYDHTGRRAEWRALVAEIVPTFVDPVTDGPSLGREAEWV
ncbi:MAG: hypothetical protein HGA45_40985, partial [Chloroflexales bacterium]|nr:hypothetical protein [Chloroflexales bacterium]